MFAAAMPAIGAIGSAAIGALGGILGGKSESKGQREANEMNLAIAREQMAFQERMANTSWQRGVADMRAAGINPMLAVSKGGATAPTGSTATMQNENAGIARGISQGANSAATVLQTFLQLKQMEAETRRLNAEAAMSEAKVPKAEVMSTGWKVAQAGLSKVSNVASNLKSGKPLFQDPLDMAVNAGSTHVSPRMHLSSAKSISDLKITRGDTFKNFMRLIANDVLSGLSKFK